MSTSGKASGIKSGLLWTFGERITAQLVTALVTIVLARILSPEHYGVLSIVTVFITVCNVFASSGMGTALVQKKEIDRLDYNTAFIISFTLSAALYLILFFTSPLIAAFYKMPELKPVLRVIGLRLPVTAVNTIQHAKIRREMSFKRFFIATLSGTVISGAVGIGMAMKGFGVWALVGQYLTNTTIDTIVLVFVERWIPKLQFSFARARSIFSFGWKVLATDLVFTVESEIRGLMIGKVFGSEDLAFFDQGRKYPAIIIQNVNTAINKVMLPVYSRQQDEVFALKELLRKTVRIGLFLMSPLLMGFAAVSNTFVPMVLTEKWNECIPYIQIFCLAYLTRPLESTCNQALLAVGKSGMILKLMIIIHSVDLLLLLIAVFCFHSVLLIAIASILVTLTSLILFLCATNSVLGYRFKEQLSDTLPTLLAVAIMTVCVYFVGRLIPPMLIRFIVQIVTGIAVYAAVSYKLRLEGFTYTLSLLKKLKNREYSQESQK